MVYKQILIFFFFLILFSGCATSNLILVETKFIRYNVSNIPSCNSDNLGLTILYQHNQTFADKVLTCADNSTSYIYLRLDN